MNVDTITVYKLTILRKQPLKKSIGIKHGAANIVIKITADIAYGNLRLSWWFLLLSGAFSYIIYYRRFRQMKWLALTPVDDKLAAKSPLALETVD